jgi:hypothetical protein
MASLASIALQSNWEYPVSIKQTQFISIGEHNLFTNERSNVVYIMVLN